MKRIYTIQYRVSLKFGKNVFKFKEFISRVTTFPQLFVKLGNCSGG